MAYADPLHINTRTKTDSALQEAERQNWGPTNTDVIRQTIPVLDADPWEGQDGPCGYGQQVDKNYWDDMPLDAEIIKSHRNWVNNRRQWSGVSKYLQESIEPTVDWRGIKPGGIGPPEPVPQNCSRAELTEYGPADFATFVTQERRRCGDPVLNPAEMAHEGAPPFNMFGF